MDFQITNPEVFNYPDHADEITLPVKLGAGGYSVEAIAKVDSGAGICLFSREIAAHLGLVVEQGIHTVLRTLSGPIEAFGHRALAGREKRRARLERNRRRQLVARNFAVIRGARRRDMDCESLPHQSCAV